MGRFDGMLICTDLDGTLLRNDKTVSDENREAMRYFKAEGGYFTFITGRMPFFVSEMYEAVRPNCPIGCVNGGALYDYEAQKYLWSTELSRDALDLVEHVDRNLPQIGIQYYTLDKVYICGYNSSMCDFLARTGLPYLPAHYREIEEPLVKVVFGDDDNDRILEVERLLKSHPRAADFDFIRSERTLYEILPKGANKGTLLPRLAAHLGVEMRNTIAVGDYDNDISMIRAAGIGVAVANATPAARAAADLVTVSNEEHAIAKIVSDLDRGVLRP